MQLSEEDYEQLVDKAVAAKKGTGALATQGELANLAFQLGVERARVVKPLVWEKRAHYEEAVDQYTAGFVRGEQKSFCGSCRGETIDYFDTLDEAKATCQAHHEAYVLSMLEAV